LKLNNVFVATLIVAALLTLMSVAGCQQPAWQQQTFTLSKGCTEVCSFDLVKGRTLTAQFGIEPEDAEIAVIIGPSAKCGCDYCELAYTYMKYSDIENNSRIEFQTPNNSSYTIWMKPGLYQMVTVTLKYYFSS